MTSLVLDYRASFAQPDRVTSLNTYLSNLQDAASVFFDAPPEPVHYKNYRLQGKVLVQRSLLEGSESNCYPHTIRQELLDVDDMALDGMELQLPDPENGGVRRLSFVCTQHHDPALDGLLVLAENQSECQLYSHHEIQRADWFLAVPQTSIRYCLAKWIPEFLNWVRRHFLPTLHSAIASDFLTQAIAPATSTLAPDRMFMSGNDPDIEFAALAEKLRNELRMWTEADG